MFRTPYKFCQLGHEKAADEKNEILKVYKYSFSSEGNKYLFEIELYVGDFYVGKYYLRKHKLNKNRYKLLTQEYKAPRVISTCMSIFKSIFDVNPKASFGFMGANTYDPEKQTEELKSNTKRYKVYRYAFINSFGENAFTYYGNDMNSTFMAINTCHESQGIIKDEIDLMLAGIYPDL
jgi:hypothetical protein